MRKINEIILHCSDSSFGDAAIIDSWHKERGWSGIGYHYVILNGRPKRSKDYNPLLDGEVQKGRADKNVGAHARGHNAHSIGICLIGVDRFTIAQLESLVGLIKELGVASIKGHCDYDKGKTCPNFNAELIGKLVREESFSDELNFFDGESL